MAAMDFGAPKPSGEHTDMGKLAKLAQRVEGTIRNDVLFPEPKELEPSSVLVGINNRDGAPPNVQHIHHQILKGFFTKGFDRTRPLPGICVKYESPEGKQKLIEHNKRFSKGNKLLPIIDESKALYGSLAGSHLNLCLRLIAQGAHSPAGDLRALMDTHGSLAEVVKTGHRWWVLPEKTAEDKQVDISLWRNQDQNENSGTNEIEILQTIVATADVMRCSSKSDKVPLGDLVERAHRRHPAKISPTVMSTLVKYFVQYLGSGDHHLIQELVDYHSVKVNPRELIVSNQFFSTLVTEAPFLKTPYTKHYLLLTQYTNEKTRDKADGASIAAFLDSQTLVSLVKKIDQLETVEKKIREIRDSYIGILEVICGSLAQAHLELAVYMNLIIRSLLAKPWPDEFKSRLSKVPVGKFSAAKIKDLGIHWAAWVDEHYPDERFALKANLAPPEDSEAQKDDFQGRTPRPSRGKPATTCLSLDLSSSATTRSP